MQLHEKVVVFEVATYLPRFFSLQPGHTNWLREITTEHVEFISRSLELRSNVSGWIFVYGNYAINFLYLNRINF